MSIKDQLEKVYPGKSDIILKELNVPGQQETERNEWYKNFNLYVAYPDSFKNSKGEFNLHTLNEKLESINSLGFNALHVLPFFKSPLIDFGFDVDDFYRVRDFLGGNEAFDKVLETAKKLNMRVFADIILNHISYNHEWFVKATEGDNFYREFFYYSVEKPVLIKRERDAEAVWAYYDHNGIELKIRIIFPEQAGEVPHWIQGKDGYWYYHTFYPHQLDLDWHNPYVFIEMAKVLIYWAQKGLSFRLDAIPFLGKDLDAGIIESSTMNHDVVEALHTIVKNVNAESVFLVEAFQPIFSVLRFFGETGIESELAYNFQFMNALWASLLEYDNSHVLEAIKLIENTPKWGAWVTFLRNHDELSLEFTDPELRKKLVSKLSSHGKEFREGFGMSGRTASFLEGNPKRIVMAHALLASFPGNPAVIYGDEIGKENDEENMKIQRDLKIKRTGETNIAEDTRDINRGHIEDKDLDTLNAKYIMEGIKEIFKTRENVGELKFSDLKSLNTQKDLVCLEYVEKKLFVIINLGGREISYEIDKDKNLTKLFAVNQVEIENNFVKLGEYGCAWFKFD